MKGWSASNLKYMRFFAQHCPDRQFGQQAADQLPWFHVVTLLTKLDSQPVEEREILDAAPVAEKVLRMLRPLAARYHAVCFGLSEGCDVRASRVWAASLGRHFVVPDDIKMLAIPCLAHRLILDPESVLA